MLIKWNGPYVLIYVVLQNIEGNQKNTMDEINTVYIYKNTRIRHHYSVSAEIQSSGITVGIGTEEMLSEQLLRSVLCFWWISLKKQIKGINKWEANTGPTDNTF